MTWNPETHPWRVQIVLSGSQFPYGWRSVETVYASEAEARAVFDAPLPAFGSKIMIQFAENAPTWRNNGRWRQVARRLRTERTRNK